MGRGPPPGTGRCFNCGIDGHWARDCKAGDWKNKCYRCGERGHIERNCQNSPRNLRCLLITFFSSIPLLSDISIAAYCCMLLLKSLLVKHVSGVREVIHGHHLHAVDGGAAGATAEAVAIGMQTKPLWIIFLSYPCYCLSCVSVFAIRPFLTGPCITSSRSRSPSGSPRGGRRDRDERRSRSLSYSRSPRRSASPSAKEKEHSPTPNGSRSPRSPSPRDQVSPPPKDNGERNGSDRGDSPAKRENRRSRSRSRSPSDGYRSPAANGRSPSPRYDRSPSPKGNAGDDDDRGSPRGSQSP